MTTHLAAIPERIESIQDRILAHDPLPALAWEKIHAPARKLAKLFQDRHSLAATRERYEAAASS